MFFEGNNKVATSMSVIRQTVLTMALVLQATFWSHLVVADDKEQSEANGVIRLWPDNLFAIEFSDQKHGIIAGESGRVLRTSDGGESWALSYIGTSELIRRVSFVDQGHAWAVGHRGSVFHSENGGETWIQQRPSDDVYLRDISFSDTENGWAVGHGATILNTKDGGASWKPQRITGYTGRDLPRLHGVVALSADRAVAVGEFGVIVHTENGGELWTTTPVETEVTWTAIDGVQGELVIVGLDGNAARLTLATEEQRQAIVDILRQQAEAEEAKEKRKARLRKKEYIPQPINVSLGEVEYILDQFDTSSSEHFFDVDFLPDGKSVIAGRGLILGYDGKGTAPFASDDNLPVEYMWFGGVAANGTGKFMAVGIRGLVVQGEVATRKYWPKLTVAGPIPETIKVESTNWDKNND